MSKISFKFPSGQWVKMECSWVTETSIITHVMVCISNCYKGCQMLAEVSVTDRQAFHKFQLSNLQYRRHNLWLRVNENKWAPFNRYHTNSSIARSLHRRPVTRERQSAPWASCQIRNNVACACAGNAGNVFPDTAGEQSRHTSRHVRDARAVMHVGIAN